MCGINRDFSTDLFEVGFNAVSKTFALFSVGVSDGC